MAKIDVSKIEGYAEMSAEDKLKALEEYEFEVPTPEPACGEESKLKEALSRANSDAAEWKRKYRATLDDAKRAEEERAEQDKARDEELKTLRRDKSVSGFLAQYLSIGYPKDLAARAAEATADGDTNTIMLCQQDFLEAKTKEIEEAALNKQPKLTPGAPPTSKTAEEDAQDAIRRHFGLPPKH